MAFKRSRTCLPSGRCKAVKHCARVMMNRSLSSKTENRLSRQLASEDLTDRFDKWLCWERAKWVDADTVTVWFSAETNSPVTFPQFGPASVRICSTAWLEAIGKLLEADELTQFRNGSNIASKECESSSVRQTVTASLYLIDSDLAIFG